MRKINYEDYFNKVFGCWLGKSIAGTIGAPFEGRKELFSYTYDPRSIENMLPNDDLDLQVLWLEVMEKKGIYFKTEDLADAFLSQCPYAPGEYAVFKKNYKRGIRPPLSGKFNNSYYMNGMGCPIRSEIWACISPGNTRLASDYSWKDGIMDHGEDSVQAEVFLAAMEAEAFFERDIHKLLEIGLHGIPCDNKVAKLVGDVISWFEKGYEWRYTRELIINKYGHPDCTNLYQNMGFTVLALLYGKGDFIDTTMITLNCGYDTDCTCATVGALLGIVSGAQYLMDSYSFTDTGYILGVESKRRSSSIYDLAEDTCRVGLTVAAELNREIEITGCPDYVPVPHEKATIPAKISVDYPDGPAIGFHESREVRLSISNNTPKLISGTLEIKIPAGWTASPEKADLAIKAGCTEYVTLSVSVPESIEKLDELNFIDTSFITTDNQVYSYRFGLVGAAVWKMYGPFWDNNLTIPPIDYWASYYAHIKGKDDNDTADITRTYHLNSVADTDKPYLTEPDLKILDDTAFIGPSIAGEIINTYTDRFSVNDFVTLKGPCVVYLRRLLLSPEERTLGIQVGNTDAYKLWVNDTLISESNEPAWCTNENKHVLNFKLNKGINTVVFKLSRRSANASYSLIFSEGGPCTNHYCDFSSVIPK